MTYNRFEIQKNQKIRQWETMENMKHYSAILALLAIGVFIGWVWWPTLQSLPAPREYHLAEPRPPLRLGHNMPRESALGMAAAKLAQEITTATDGGLRITVFPEGTLGNDLEMMEMARNGDLDLVLIPTAKMSIPVPAMQYADMPFYFPTPEVFFRLLDGEPGQLLLTKLHGVNLMGITFWGNGFKQFTANRPIHTPADLRDLKVRVMKSRLIMDQFEDLDAKPIPIEFRETRQALADGVVDGQENPLAAIVARGIHQVQSHLTLSNHAYLAYVLACSQKSFGKLRDQEQSLLVATAKGLTPWQREETARQEEGFLRQIQQAGVTIHRLTEEERRQFVRKLRHLSLQFEEVIGSDLLSKTEELLNAWQSPQEKATQILVGLDADLSLTGASAGLAIKRGALLAMEEINLAGGVLGKHLVLVSRNNMAMPSRGEDNFRHLAGLDHLVAIIGGMHSSVAIPQSELADQLKVPFLVPWAAAAGLVEHPDHSPNFVFRLAANDRLAGTFLVDAALALGSRVALVLENSVWGQSILPSLQARFQEKGVTPVLVDWINRGETDCSQHMERIQATGADAALLVLNPIEGVTWVRAMVAQKLSLPLVAHWGITGGDFFGKTREIQGKVNLAFLQTFAPFNEVTERIRTFQQSYKAMFDVSFLDTLQPHTGLAQAYDLVHLLARAMIQANSTDRQAVRDALEHINLHVGLIKEYHTPFTADKHDALDQKDYFLSRFDPYGHIVPLQSGDQP